MNVFESYPSRRGNVEEGKQQRPACGASGEARLAPVEGLSLGGWREGLGEELEEHGE